MGTSQILFLVLSVIIIGLAVAVGMQMVENQYIQSHRNEIISMINQYMMQGLEYRRMPKLYGGGEGTYIGFTPIGAEKSTHVAGNSPGAVKVETNNVIYYIEWYFNDRLKIIASSKEYGEGNPWPNTYNARITAVFDNQGKIDNNGFQISGDW